MLSTEDVKKLVEAGIPDSEVQVVDLTGTSDHFQVQVRAAAFAGKSLIEQHKMVHAALGAHLTNEIHAVDIRTAVPEA